MIMDNKRKLVSIITGTYNRNELVYDMYDNIKEQTYPNIEHIIVSDGPNEELKEWAKDVDVKFIECGRWWSGFLAASSSAVPFQVAQWLASGDYILWLSDDERMEPTHIEKLVNLLESKDVDFTYSRVLIHFNAEVLGYHRVSSVIGSDPPVYGQITNCLFRVELLDYAGFETHVGNGTDWYQINKWMQAGASWAMLNEITLSHRVDKLGEGPNYRKDKQPLRGHKNIFRPLKRVR